MVFPPQGLLTVMQVEIQRDVDEQSFIKGLLQARIHSCVRVRV